jgi:2-(3-amino-3-carboxypropyl)histidine synthase
MKKSLKILYIEAKSNLDYKLPQKELKKLPKKLLLLYSLQYKTLAQSIKKQLESNKIKIKRFQQVLGCSKINTNLSVLLISTGKFHAQNLYLQAPIIYILENKKIIKIPQETINKLKTQRKTALIKFLKADTIGILVSTKPGQNSIKQAINLKQKLQDKNKQTYLFLSNNININQFENFSIDSWVNTACEGLVYDNPNIINLRELPKL